MAADDAIFYWLVKLTSQTSATYFGEDSSQSPQIEARKVGGNNSEGFSWEISSSGTPFSPLVGVWFFVYGMGG